MTADLNDRLTAIEKQLAVLIAQQTHMAEMAEHARKQRERQDDDLRKLFVAQSDMAASIAMLTARNAQGSGAGPASTLAAAFGVIGTTIGFTVAKILGLH